MKMKFNTRLKYKGAYYPALVPIEVNPEDLPELQRIGGVIIEEDTETKPEERKTAEHAEISNENAPQTAEDAKPEQEQGEKPKGRRKANKANNEA